MARAIGRTTQRKSMAWPAKVATASNRATDREKPVVSHVKVASSPTPTGAADSAVTRWLTSPPTSLRLAAYAFSAVMLATLLWYQMVEDFSVPYSSITPALIFSAVLSVVGARAASPGIRLVLVAMACLVAEELVAWFGLGIVISFVLLIAASVFLIAALNDAVIGPFHRADVLRGLRIGAVSVAILTGINVLLELGFVSSVGLSASGRDLVLAVGFIVGAAFLARFAESGQRRHLVATGAGLLLLAAISHLIAFDADPLETQYLVLFLGVAALLATIEISVRPLEDTSPRRGGALTDAWGECLMWVRARWLHIVAFGFFGALVSLLWIVAGLLLVVVLPLMLILSAAQGQDLDSGWGIALFAGAVALPQLAGLTAGAGSVVIDQAMAASLQDGHMDVRSFWRSFTDQWRTSGLLGLGYFFGYLVCFIPGILFVVRWGFALPLGMRSGQRGSAALTGSWRLTAGHGWTVLGFQLISNTAVLLSWGVGLVLAYACEWLWGAAWLSAAMAVAAWGFVLAVSAIGRVSLFERFTAEQPTGG